MALTTSIHFLKQHLQRASGLRIIIYLNILLYLLVGLGQILLNSLGSAELGLLRFGALYSSSYRFLSQPWGLLTYSWLHDGLLHLVPNMLFLYIIDTRMQTRWSQARLVALYILGYIGGGILLVLGYLVASALGGYFISLPVYGSSGAIFTLMAAIAVDQPRQMYHSALVGRISLIGILCLIILLDLGFMLLFDNNTGGHLLHLIGIGIGAGYAYLLRRHDFDLVAPLLALTKPMLSKNPQKIVPHIPTRVQRSLEEVDRVLDKMKSSGYTSLSASEREILAKASQEHKNKL